MFSSPPGETIEQFRARVGARFSIKNVGLARVYSWTAPSIFEVEEANWDYFPYSDGSIQGLRLSDGDIILFRDNDEELVELTPEQQNKLKREEAKKRYDVVVVICLTDVLDVILSLWFRS